jgi:predicted CXXCH cytochrome family protein
VLPFFSMPGQVRYVRRARFPAILTVLFGAAMLLLANGPLDGLLDAEQAPSPSRASSSRNEYIGSEPCAGCHSEIYKSYISTAMARASGPANQQLITGEFQHAPSKVHYRVYEDKGEAWLSFDRASDPQVHGSRKLLYFIGSGHRGRTYLFSDDGFVFESPVNWYAQKGVWDMAPAYQKARNIPLNLPAVEACLRCHTSNAQRPLPGTENKYSLPLFAHAGITCERCHGPGGEHASSGGAIVNPAKLSAERRDSICMQCHLEGNAAVEQPSHSLNDFQPGDRLSDTVHYFVLQGGSNDGFRALSQTEALALSVCKRKSGEKMSCTSCHDPHASPAPAERVTYYREKCLSCHGAALGAKHHAKTPDCTQCHMPRTTTADIAHTQATDHSIPRVLRTAEKAQTSYPTAPHLVRFPPGDAPDSDRDLALAWESVAKSNNAAEHEAEKYLRKAVAEEPKDAVEDVPVLTDLAYEDMKHGAAMQASELYELVLRLDPESTDAETNLGVIEAQSGHLNEAMKLWEVAFEREPERSVIGLNLARGFCFKTQFDKARACVERVLEFNPDLPAARLLEKELKANPPSCGGF